MDTKSIVTIPEFSAVITYSEFPETFETVAIAELLEVAVEDAEVSAKTDPPRSEIVAVFGETVNVEDPPPCGVVEGVGDGDKFGDALEVGTGDGFAVATGDGLVCGNPGLSEGTRTTEGEQAETSTIMSAMHT